MARWNTSATIRPPTAEFAVVELCRPEEVEPQRGVAGFDLPIRVPVVARETSKNRRPLVKTSSTMSGLTMWGRKSVRTPRFQSARRVGATGGGKLVT
jgi:hypothetical protein